MKKLGKYTKENIIEITKIASGDKIGELALINTGLMNKCNDVPYFDYRINKEVSLDYIYKKFEINSIYKFLLINSVVIKCMNTKVKKNFIKG